MADNGTADILRSIHQAILSASRCFENGDVDCNIVLTDLRQSKRCLNLVNQEENNKRDIDSTISALIE